MKTIELSRFEKTKSSRFGGTQAFVIYFVYPKNGEAVVVKGMSEEVEKYVKEHYPIAFYRYTMWRNGFGRGYWRFTDRYRFISHEGRRLRVTIYHKNGDLKRVFTLRRIPHKWIPEFD